MQLLIVIEANLAIAGNKVHSSNFKVGSMETKVAKKDEKKGKNSKKEKKRKETRSVPWGKSKCTINLSVGDLTVGIMKLFLP